MDNIILKQNDILHKKSKPTFLFPDTTVLSPYISNGSLSTRLFYYRLKETAQEAHTTSTQLSASLERQLQWRELAYVIGSLTPHFDQMIGNPSCVCSKIPWLTKSESELMATRWEKGETGYPAVDAAMNQLKTEGWVHHLLRQLVANFLTRGSLLVYWKHGRNVFTKYLLDYDWCVNSFSWHWLSCDSFFHQEVESYNPTALLKTYDRAGCYIRKYLPVLQAYPDEFIHEPWEAPLAVQRDAGCVIGVDYPAPIVNHVRANKENLKKIKKAAKEFYHR